MLCLSFAGLVAAYFSEVTLGVITVLVVVTFYEGLAFLAGYSFLYGYAAVHYFVLNCVKSFGSGFFTSFETLVESLLHLLEETGLMGATLISMTRLTNLSCLTRLLRLTRLTSVS
jgi:hypothetical protein